MSNSPTPYIPPDNDLRKQVAAKNAQRAAANPTASTSTGEDFDCVKISKEYIALIDFHIGPNETHSFAPSQLFHASHIANPAAVNDPTKPKQILKLGFTTGTVVITDSRLQFLAQPLSAGQVAAVAKLPARFAELHQDKAHVEDITVTFIGEEQSQANPES